MFIKSPTKQKPALQRNMDNVTVTFIHWWQKHLRDNVPPVLLERQHFTNTIYSHIHAFRAFGANLVLVILPKCTVTYWLYGKHNFSTSFA